mgnify:CR=1 FL=1
MADVYTELEYAEWPYASPSGRRGNGNGLWLTNALFLERADQDKGYEPDFTLEDEAVWHEPSQTWLPSARMIYVHSKSEYDAMRKMVGNLGQWKQLKKLAWFRELLEAWQEEWYMRKENRARELMDMHALDNAATAKALYEDAKRRGKGAGRPVKLDKPKARSAQSDPEGDAVDSDAARVLEFRQRGT